jgi:hypothetical protein
MAAKNGKWDLIREDENIFSRLESIIERIA